MSLTKSDGRERERHQSKQCSVAQRIHNKRGGPPFLYINDARKGGLWDGVAPIPPAEASRERSSHDKALEAASNQVEERGD